MFDEPPDPPSPEEAPQEYAAYLRRRVVAGIRQYLVDHGHEELRAKDSYFGDQSTMEAIRAAILDLDNWKREFGIKEID